MQKRLWALVAALGLLLTPALANAAPKPKPYSPKESAFSRCDYEYDVKGYEAKLQSFLNSNGRCTGPNRIVNSVLPSSKPNTVLTLRSGLLDTALCKLRQPAGAIEFRGFPSGNDQNFANRRHPGPGSVIQVVGLTAPDAPAGKSLPSQEYKFYLDKFREWFANVNNSGEPVEIRIKDKWFDYGEKLEPLKLSHSQFTDQTKQFSTKFVKLIDPEIDFSNVDYLIVVVPVATRYDVISQTGMSGQTTDEGPLRNLSVLMQPNFDRSQTHTFLNFLTIAMSIHELYHPGFNMGDQNGDHLGWFENRGMGNWGMFATGTTDMLQWQKWLLGFTTDSQVACASASSTSTNWLAPGSTKTNKQKLLVVPISSEEAIVVESVRATGLNYKLKKVEQGALVYKLDMTDVRYNFGYEVQFPDSRKWKSLRYSMDTAPLKKGESFTYKGVKITNVEWGDFGDVIKVEPVK
jgi:hypothetical protein